MTTRHSPASIDVSASTRAHRFLNVVPLVYRPLVPDHPAEWSNGLSVNMSRTGLLLEASAPLPVGAMLELEFCPPPPLEEALGTGELRMVAEVVRSVQASAQIPFPVGVRLLSASPREAPRQ